MMLFLCLPLCFQLRNFFSLELRALLCGVAEFVVGSYVYEKMLKLSLHLPIILNYKYNQPTNVIRCHNVMYCLEGNEQDFEFGGSQ